MQIETEKQLEQLGSWLKPRGRLAVAFSGGVDSSLVLAAAMRYLDGDSVLAITGRSETLPATELAAARQLARDLGARHRVIDTRELDDEAFSANPPDRCYYCKREFWSRAASVAAGEGISCLADGTNADDTSGHRPGMRACEEAGVLHPLVEIGVGKQRVRAMARMLGLPNWDKPAQACLSSRLPYGTGITAEALARVEAAEDYLRELGLKQLRVRDHGGVARIEVPVEELRRLAADDLREAIVYRFRELGYDYVSLDLEGFRSGSMNVALDTAVED